MPPQSKKKINKTADDSFNYEFIRKYFSVRDVDFLYIYISLLELRPSVAVRNVPAGIFEMYGHFMLQQKVSDHNINLIFK